MVSGSASADGERQPDERTDAPPLGGDPQTENQLEADNPAEEETLKALDPDSASS